MERLREAVRELSVRHGAWGYTKIAKLLRNDGWAAGKDLVARLRREMNLRIPPKPPKKVRRGESTGRPTEATHRGHVWSWDFIHGRTERGGAFKVLTIMDEYTRECHRLHVDRRINAEVVRAVMDAVVAQHGAPGYNGSEFIEKHLRRWLASSGVKTIYIEPGCPWENPFVESLHDKIREECLNREQHWSLSEARVVLEDWRHEYNTLRPHRSLKLETPWAYAHSLLAQAGDSAPAAAPPPPPLRPQLDSLYRQITQSITPTTIPRLS